MRATRIRATNVQSTHQHPQGGEKCSEGFSDKLIKLTSTLMLMRRVITISRNAAARGVHILIRKSVLPASRPQMRGGDLE